MRHLQAFECATAAMKRAAVASRLRGLDFLRACERELGMKRERSVPADAVRVSILRLTLSDVSNTEPEDRARTRIGVEVAARSAEGAAVEALFAEIDEVDARKRRARALGLVRLDEVVLQDRDAAICEHWRLNRCAVATEARQH